MEYKEIKLEKEGNIATIYMNRPDKMNALNPEMRRELITALGELDKDDDARAIILTGAGEKAFCAGADMGWFQGKGAPPEPTRYEITERRAWYVPLFRQLRIPTIAAINGFAIGIGLSFSLICDIRIMADTAKLQCGWIKRGLTPDGGAIYLLPRLIGLEKALEMFYTGDMVGAEQAMKMGLVSRVVPRADLMGTAKELAGKIADGPPIAMELTKCGVYWAQESDLGKAIDFENYGARVTMATEDHKEGVMSFMEKRKAEYRGR